jgi:hypothetical protein
LSIVYWARTVGLLSLCAAGAAIAENYSLAAHVRTANDRFKDVAVAVSEGYAPIPCASGADGGAMGVHYVKASQAIMYEPKVDGKMELIAVEYITTKGPASLEGQLFNFTGSPNRYGLPPFYELHVWAWKANPRGAFSDMNPAVSCDGIAWFRLNHAIIDGAGPLSSVLGPADWTHGIARPFQDVVADPHPNLTVQLFKRPVDPHWRPRQSMLLLMGELDNATPPEPIGSNPAARADAINRSVWRRMAPKDSKLAQFISAESHRTTLPI